MSETTHVKLLINGEAQDASSGEHFETINLRAKRF